MCERRKTARPQLTSTLLSGNSLLLGMTAVTCCGFFNFSNSALPFLIIST